LLQLKPVIIFSIKGRLYAELTPARAGVLLEQKPEIME